MSTSGVDFFSNLYVCYYYGCYTKCTDAWKDYDIACPYSKLYYIRKGECELVIEGEVYHAMPGQCYLIPAHTRHSYYLINENHMEKYWMHFELKTGDEQALQGLRLPYFVTVPKEEQERWDSYFQRIYELAVLDDTASRLAEKAEILNLISAYIRLAEKTGLRTEKASSKAPRQNILFVIDYMNRHLAEKITVETLAGLLHVHPNYFIRMFKTYMGVPPMNYVNRLRVERAKALLENTTLPVSDVMTQIGFDDISTFSSFFKHYTGYNPRLFRDIFS